jgi:NAD(P)H-nitrite reductase large subunit
MSINRLQRPRLVVVGNGMAGMRTVEELVARAPDRFDITVIGGEPHPSYNRILLSSALAGERTLAEIVIQPSSWYEKHGIHLIAGNHATAIDPVTRRVVNTNRTTGASAVLRQLMICYERAPVISQLRDCSFLPTLTSSPDQRKNGQKSMEFR